MTIKAQNGGLGGGVGFCGGLAAVGYTAVWGNSHHSGSVQYPAEVGEVNEPSSHRVLDLHPVVSLRIQKLERSHAIDAFDCGREALNRFLGAGLLKDAMLRTLQAADIAGIRAFAVHAKDDEARTFYEHFDFVPSLSDPFHLFRLLKDIRALFKS